MWKTEDDVVVLIKSHLLPSSFFYQVQEKNTRYSSKNYVRKFLRALHPKWRAKVTSIEESKELTFTILDDLLEPESSLNEGILVDEDVFDFRKVKRSKDEEFAMAVRDFKKFFKRRGRCGDPNHLIGECPKTPKDKNKGAFVGGSWSDSGEEDDEKAKDETYLVAQASNETTILESLNVTFDKTPPPSKTPPLVDDDLDEEEIIKVTEKKNLENDIKDETLEIDDVVNIKESMNHPLENVIGNLNQRTLRSQDQNQSNFFCIISTIEPKNVNKALKDESKIISMQEELNQFIANDVWELVTQPKNMKIIVTKWVYRNKLDENGVVS
ncbi:hypothetical protein Tco_0820465 [Tanacetum coccineum]|uniref:Uncharacterized protein n=1 Tax=Tanacetum coccineum TaxID=301880 RepID=A0ABQ5ADS7_9ASTR